jgi:hypothetical protein
MGAYARSRGAPAVGEPEAGRQMAREVAWEREVARQDVSQTGDVVDVVMPVEQFIVDRLGLSPTQAAALWGHRRGEAPASDAVRGDGASR